MSSSRSGPPSCSEVFSDDLINEILLRLPVKSLLRCKAVSKPWYFLISSPAFVKSHLSNANTKPEADETLIAHAEDNTTIVLLNHISLQLESHLNFPFSQGEFPFVPDNILVGSTKGIVCVYVYHDHHHPNQRYLIFTKSTILPGSIYLWNPATKQSLCVMQPTIPSLEYPRHEFHGFGFDPVDNDFKVVRVLGLPFEAEVYSSNKNVWRKIWLEPRLFMFANDYTVCVDGFVCWMGFQYIMAFDLNKEVFNCVTKLPEDFNTKPHKNYDNHITEVNDSIALVQCKPHIGKVKLWMLNDVESLRGGGVEASWTLMLSVIADMPVFFVNSYFNGGDCLLMSSYNEDGSAVWLSHQSHEKKTTVLPVSSESFHGQIFKYTESLVSIPGSRQVTWDARENHHN